MKFDVYLRHLDWVDMKVVAEPGILMELAEQLTFFIPNHKYHPKVKARVWDGRISVVNRLTGICNAGLAKTVKDFCDSRGYTFGFDPEFLYNEFTREDLNSFIDTLNIPSKFERRDYQLDAVQKCIKTNRRTLLAPTSAGKSMMIYILFRWYLEMGIKTLLIVPSVGLVRQMAGDFIEYGFEGEMHLSTDGLSKNLDIQADVVITTWQALESGNRKMPKGWYEQFGCVFGDEAHGCAAKSLISILSSCREARYRFGTTGTLAEEPLAETNIVGLFGPKLKTVSTKELMDQGYVARLKITCLVINYPKADRKTVKNLDYPGEINFLINHPGRNKIIRDLVKSLKGNNLTFFRNIEHGKLLHEMIKDAVPDKAHFYIDGSVKGEDRDAIRYAVESEEGANLVASLGTTSTGVSIKRLNNMIAAHPGKSKIKVMQSIGRMLRLNEEKKHTGAELYDIVDNLSIGQYKNYVLNHFLIRTKMYDAENFDYKIVNVELNDEE